MAYMLLSFVASLRLSLAVMGGIVICNVRIFRLVASFEHQSASCVKLKLLVMQSHHCCTCNACFAALLSLITLWSMEGSIVSATCMHLAFLHCLVTALHCLGTALYCPDSKDRYAALLIRIQTFLITFGQTSNSSIARVQKTCATNG